MSHPALTPSGIVVDVDEVVIWMTLVFVALLFLFIALGIDARDVYLYVVSLWRLR